MNIFEEIWIIESMPRYGDVWLPIDIRCDEAEALKECARRDRQNEQPHLGGPGSAVTRAVKYVRCEDDS